MKNFTAEELPLLNNALNKNIDKMNSSRGKDITMVIGPTGAGKSTLINYMLKCVMSLNEKFNIEAEIPYVEIGHSMITSHTDCAEVVPKEIIKDTKNYLDSVGFFENRSIVNRIMASISTECAIKNANKINAVLIPVSYSTLVKTEGRFKSFKELSMILGRLFKDNPMQIKNSIIIVIQKSPDDNINEDKINAKLEQAYGQAEKSLADLKKELKIEGDRYDESKISPADREKLHELIHTLRIIELFRISKRIIVDPLDNGDSRKNLEKHIDTAMPIQVNSFNFYDAEPDRKKFEDYIAEMSVEGHKQINDYYDSNKKIADNKLKLDKLVAKNEKLKRKLTSLENDAAYSFFTHRDILIYEIKEIHNEIEEFKHDLVNFQEQIDRLEGLINHIKNAPDYLCGEDSYDEYFYRSWLPTHKPFSFNFSYPLNNIVKEHNCHFGGFSNIIDKREQGKYECTFSTYLTMARKATVRCYAKNQYVQGNPSLIQSYTDQIARLYLDIEATKKKITKNQQQKKRKESDRLMIHQKDKSIKEKIQLEKDDINSDIEKNDNEITQLKSSTLSCVKLIYNNVALVQSSSVYSAIKHLTSLIKFNAKIVNEFVAQYDKFMVDVAEHKFKKNCEEVLASPYFSDAPCATDSKRKLRSSLPLPSKDDQQDCSNERIPSGKMPKQAANGTAALVNKLGLRSTSTPGPLSHSTDELKKRKVPELAHSSDDEEEEIPVVDKRTAKK